MNQSKKYAVWNNKGGVGKTSLSFIIATQYARDYPEQEVVVVDMCPQANLSEILLGGADGSKVVTVLIEQNKTVGAYINKRISSPHKRLSIQDELAHLVQPSTYNKQIPSNLYLACGDPNLEIQAQVINQIGAQDLPVDCWRNVRLWLRDFIEGCDSKFKNPIFFIDCNPSFSAYTELAMAAANRLIIPCTSDGSSARAIDNIASLLYGIDQSHNIMNYANKAKKHEIRLPLIHTVVFNRSTQYNKKASKAFDAMNKEIINRMNRLQEKNPSCFFSHEDPKHLFETVPDTHSAAIVCSHNGMPLCDLKSGSYDVHDIPAQVNSEPLERYQNVMQQLVSRLS